MRKLSMKRSWAILPLILAITALAGADLARAECSPGQLQEAALAYANVKPLLDAQNWSEAIPRLQSIVDICPEFPEAMRALGDAYLGNGQPQLAERAYQEVVEVRGDAVEAPDYAKLAKALAKQEKFNEARAAYIKAQQLAPDDCGVLFNLGVLHMAAGYMAQAVTALEHAEEVCPQLRDTILPQLHKACQKASDQQRTIGNAERADYYAKLASEYGGSAGGSTTYNMGVQAMRAGNYADAISYFESLVAENPDHANAWLSLARARDAAGADEEAITAYERYVALRPDNLREVVSLGLLQAEVGRCDAAQTTISRAITNNQAKGARVLAGLYYGWGKALECAQRYADAKTKYAQAAGSGNAEWAPRARQEVERMDQYLEYELRKKQRAAQQGG